MPMMIALKAATPQLPRTTAVADHVVAVDETDSTNALAVQMIGDGSLTLPDHQDGELAVAVVAADRQTAGRGIRCRAEPAGLLAGTQMAERRVLPRAQAGRAALGTGDSAVVRYRY